MDGTLAEFLGHPYRKWVGSNMTEVVLSIDRHTCAQQKDAVAQGGEGRARLEISLSGGGLGGNPAGMKREWSRKRSPMPGLEVLIEERGFEPAPSMSLTTRSVLLL